MRARSLPDIVRFAGIRLPGTDFNAVNNGLLVQAEFIEFDLSVARSLAAGTQIEINMEGNVIYADQNTDVGNCTIIFQDPAKSLSKPARLYVQPGSNFQLPFTRFMLENAAQAGKLMRLFYGVDIEFKPGNTNNVSISGTVNSNDLGFAYATAFASGTSPGANTPQNIFAAASNVNGATIWDTEFQSINAVVNAITASMLCKATAPATAVDGDVVALGIISALDAAPMSVSGGKQQKPVRIAAGKRLDYISSVADIAGAARKALYTLS